MLGGNRKVKAPALKKVVQEDGPEPIDLPRPLFRGFIGGDSFITKKGYRGLKLESLWVQNIFEAFKTDDPELAAIALQSSLADVNDRVVGGSFGSPYSIGDYGFYAEKQFRPQLRFLQDKARDLADQTKVYLTNEEWERVEKKLLTIAKYGNSDFTSTAVGDSFADLAIRQSAFQVAKVLMTAGIDPLVENSEGKDMFGTMKEQYHTIAMQLREVQSLKEQAAHAVMVPSAVENILNEEMRLLDCFHYLSEFGDELKLNLQNRVKEIEVDKILQRRAQLRDELFPETKVWNIAQLDKALRYITDIDELKQYIVEKISYHESHAGAFESLAKLLLANFSLVTKKDDETSVTATQSLEQDSTTPYSSVAGSHSRSSSVLRSRQAQSRHSQGDSKSRSVVSLTGESAASEALKVGFVFVDDNSVLTEDGQPMRIPKLPNVPNRLRNARIDGLNKHYGKKKHRHFDSRGTDRASGSRESTRQGTAGTANGTDAASNAATANTRVGSPSSYRGGIAEDSSVADSLPMSPLQSVISAARASVREGASSPYYNSTRAASGGYSSHPASAAGFSGRPMSNNSGQVVLHRGAAQLDSGRGTPTSTFSPRLHTGSSAYSAFGSPSTPSQKIRFAQEARNTPPPLSSKEDLYALLGVSDAPDDSSVGGRSVGSRSHNSGVPLSSAKILAKSMKESYAPLLGTLRETEDTIIMYR